MQKVNLITTEDIFSAAEDDDCTKLIRFLTDTNLTWVPQKRAPSPNNLTALEEALTHGSQQAANILACYEILGKDFIKGREPHRIVATKSVWCRCLSNSVLRMKDLSPDYRQHLRGQVEKKDYFYAQPGSKVPGEKRAFYYIVRDHYSKLLTPFEAIERPAAFMALMRLDDNFKILSPEGHTLPMHILRSQNVSKSDKISMLQFIAHFDPEVLLAPSGSEGLTPAAYSFANDFMDVFRQLFSPDLISRFRSATGKTIVDYASNTIIKKLSAKHRLQLFTEMDGVLNTFLIRNAKDRTRERFYDELVFEALETLSKRGKHGQLKEFAKVVDDRALGTFMWQIGYNFEELKKFACSDVLNENKEYFKTDLQTTFEFSELPSEMLELITAELVTRDVVSLFVINKSMSTWFKRLGSNALWQKVLRNSKLTLDGDVPMPTTEIKKYIVASERYKNNWRKGKFVQKTLFSAEESSGNIKLDDNWLTGTSSMHGIRLLNMHTNAKSTLRFIDGYNPYLYPTHCLVESPPFDPPLVAQLTVQGRLFYGRPGASSVGSFQLPELERGYYSIYPQSTERVVASNQLLVVDLATQSIVAQLPKEHARRTVSGVIPNPFDRRQSIGAGQAGLTVFDQDMQIVQSIFFEVGVSCTNPLVIDEFTVAANQERGILLYDLRNFAADKYQVLHDSYRYRLSNADVRNQRMLVECDKYNALAQIDLKTRQWERVWAPLCVRCENVRINNRYLVMGWPGEIIAYDFNA